MSSQSYIVLRAEPSIVPSLDNLGAMPRGAAAGADASAAADTISIEEATLSKAERDDLRRDPRTRAIAEPMPMKLIEPVASDSAAAAGAGNTWGIEAVGADRSPFDGSGITVAVLDTGIDPDHPAFSGVELVRKNFTSEGDDDTNGHGTHCAGTIFGQDVDGLRIGVARNVDRALIGKVLGAGGGSSKTIAEAIQWAVQNGANVISMSLGIDFPGFVDFLVNQRNLDINPATSIALEGYRSNINLFTQLSRLVAAQNAFADGCVIVGASGNESNRPAYEIAVAPPAAGNGVIAVGALEQNTATGHRVARFSNNQVNVSAPGVDVVSAFTGGGLRSLSGTSMATPHVAGVAALWAQRQVRLAGGINSETLTARLIGSGTREGLDPSSQAEDIGSGIVQAPQN
jgi:subtilisin family serine protease